MLVALVLRVICCFWGYPLVLHPDERAIVDSTIDMLRRHSWKALIYDRPDHFEIKCNSLLFTLFSWAKYKMPAYEAFEEHRAAFHVIARFYTVVFGVLLVPLTGLFTGKLADGYSYKVKRLAQYAAMFWVTFTPVFIQHSAYATPDIVLTFFVLLFAYFMHEYIVSDRTRYIYLSAVLIGVGITIKYPAAIIALVLAATVIYKSISNRRYLDILKYGLISILLVLVTMFVIAPNLFTDFEMVVINFKEEARTAHLGADGLGFWGNLKYYVVTINDNMGNISIVPFIIGLVSLCVHRCKKDLSLIIAPVYWICMSVLALHWVRWGIPMYIFFIIVMALGLAFTVESVYKYLAGKNVLKFVALVIIVLFFGLIAFNNVLTSITLTKYLHTKDMKVYTLDVCAEMGITNENTISEGYTTFDPSGFVHADTFFDYDGNTVSVKPELSYKKYLIISTAISYRYESEPDKYPMQVKFYRLLDTTYDKIYELRPENYSIQGNIIKNIPNSWNYLTSNYEVAGSPVKFYALHP